MVSNGTEREPANPELAPRDAARALLRELRALPKWNPPPWILERFMFRHVADIATRRENILRLIALAMPAVRAAGCDHAALVALEGDRELRTDAVAWAVRELEATCATIDVVLSPAAEQRDAEAELLKPGEVLARDIRKADGTRVPHTTVYGWVRDGLKLNGKQEPTKLKETRTIAGGQKVFLERDVEPFLKHSEEHRRLRGHRQA